MNEESGDFEQVALQMDPADYYHIGVMSGTADQTEAVDVTASQEILLLGVFGEEGHGYLSLTFSKGRDGWAVRMVRFGLPAERDDARARIGEIGRRFSDMLMTRFEEYQVPNIGNGRAGGTTR